jgi:hypothetical protein
LPKIVISLPEDWKRVSRNSQGTEKRPLHRQPENHNFGSLIMLAVTAGAFLLITWVATKTVLLFLQQPPLS